MTNLSINPNETIEITYEVSGSNIDILSVKVDAKDESEDRENDEIINDIKGNINKIKKFTWTPNENDTGNKYKFKLGDEEISIDVNEIPDSNPLQVTIHDESGRSAETSYQNDRNRVVFWVGANYGSNFTTSRWSSQIGPDSDADELNSNTRVDSGSSSARPFTGHIVPDGWYMKQGSSHGVDEWFETEFDDSSIELQSNGFTTRGNGDRGDWIQNLSEDFGMFVNVNTMGGDSEGTVHINYEDVDNKLWDFGFGRTGGDSRPSTWFFVPSGWYYKIETTDDILAWYDWPIQEFIAKEPEDKSGERSFGTWSQNTTGTAIAVTIGVDGTRSSNTHMDIHINDSESDNQIYNHGENHSASPISTTFIVPDGWYYKQDNTKLIFDTWIEQELGVAT